MTKRLRKLCRITMIFMQMADPINTSASADVQRIHRTTIRLIITRYTQIYATFSRKHPANYTCLPHCKIQTSEDILIKHYSDIITSSK